MKPERKEEDKAMRMP